MVILEFLRDKLTGLPYFIVLCVALFLIFAIIGYLVGEKYRSSN